MTETNFTTKALANEFIQVSHDNAPDYVDIVHDPNFTPGSEFIIYVPAMSLDIGIQTRCGGGTGGCYQECTNPEYVGVDGKPICPTPSGAATMYTGIALSNNVIAFGSQTAR